MEEIDFNLDKEIDRLESEQEIGGFDDVVIVVKKRGASPSTMRRLGKPFRFKKKSMQDLDPNQLELFPCYG